VYGNSDHREFELLGLPAAKLGVGAGGEPCRHSPCDRSARLDPISLRHARRLVAEAVR
jgi:Peptidase family M28